MTAALRVLIADDHAPTRADVREALESHERFSVCAEAFDAAGAVEAALREQPDICVLDIEMPGGGINAAWEISSRLPRVRIVMLTVSDSDTHLFSALRAGVDGYLLKDLDPASLPQALLAATEGEAAIPRKLVTRLVDGLRDPGVRRRAVAHESERQRLTSREWQVLELMGRGLSTAQIARRLVLSPATVRTHVAGITRKLRVADRDEAVRLFSGGRT